MNPRSRHPYRGWLAGSLLLTVPLLAPPASAAPRRTQPSKPARKAPAAKPQAAKPAPEAPAKEEAEIISRGEEAVLVDHALAEKTTLVLFYQPAVETDRQAVDFVHDRARQDARLRIRLVELKSFDQPIAKQYEITATPSGFVYDRNKNLVGKGATSTTWVRWSTDPSGWPG